MGEMVVTEEMLAAKYEAVLPHLDERTRRLALGADARMLGRGGIRLVARAAGRPGGNGVAGRGGAGGGRAAAGPGAAARRGPQAGRRQRPEAGGGAAGAGGAGHAGDPYRPCGGREIARKLAGELPGRGTGLGGHRQELLHDQEYRLQANPKTLEGRKPPGPGRPVPVHQRAGQDNWCRGAGISVDTKKKELVGRSTTRDSDAAGGLPGPRARP